MICAPCTERDHTGCASPNCTCAHECPPGCNSDHQHSAIRALTGRERHARMVGILGDQYLMAADEPGFPYTTFSALTEPAT